MSSAATSAPKDNFLDQIWLICTTLTEEALVGAYSKAQEAGFDLNRGIISLQESFINLRSARAVLEDALKKNKLMQLPITVQKEILGTLQSISDGLQRLSSGVDEISNLTNGIEILSTAIWKYGLHNLSDQVLGYQTKLNQLKLLEIRISEMMAALESANRASAEFTSSISDIADKKQSVTAVLQEINDAEKKASDFLEQIKNQNNTGAALYSIIQQHEKQSGELAASIKTAYNELSALDASIRKFYGEVEDYRRKLNQSAEDTSALISNAESGLKSLHNEVRATLQATVSDIRNNAQSVNTQLETDIRQSQTDTEASIEKLRAEGESNLKQNVSELNGRIAIFINEAREEISGSTAVAQRIVSELEQSLRKRAEETVEQNQTQTQHLLKELTELKEKIREQIEQATGFTLFGAFQARQNQISRAKTLWALAIAILVTISIAATSWIAHEAQSYNVLSFVFYLKLSLTVPLAFAITFCTVQYSRERRLEEEYAFKSSISVSLNPYRELVQSILQRDKDTDIGKYTEFVIDSVKNVFTPPTDKVFESDKKSGMTEKTFKQSAELIGTVLKATKS